MADIERQETTPLLVEAGPEYDIPKEDVRNGVDLNPTGDPENPLEWSTPFKWGIVALLASTAFMVTFNCTSIVPVARSIVDDLGSDATGTRFAAVLPVTIWELGEAVGPLLIGPLSELYGRYPLMNACNMVFIAGTVLAALSGNMPLFISSRALTGMAVASNVLNPAIIGDIFPPEQRGTAMSLIGFAPIIGGTAGPAFSGYVDEILGWRAVLWVCVSLAGLCELVFFVYFRETYKVKILRRRREAARTREALKNPGPKDSRVSAMSREGGSVSLLTSVTRPVAVLASSIVLVALSLFGSFVYSQFYVLATTLPIILEDVYGLSPAAIGSAFLANGIGSTIGVIISKVYLDSIYIKRRDANAGIGLPEYRLPLTVVAGFMMPPALALYGWCAELKLPLAALLSTLVLIRISVVLSLVPMMAYVVDASGVYAASALTGTIVIRCLAGAFLPLTAAELVEDLNYGWGFTVVGALSLSLALIPVLLLRYGAQWRHYSKFTRED